MSKLIINKTENEIEILNFFDLTEEEKKELIDYENYEESNFFRYNGQIYDLNDFMLLTGSFDDCKKDYHAYKSETFFSGILVKYNKDNETLKVSSYYS